MPDLKEILKEFVATANAGEYKTEGELLSAFPELSGYNSNTLKEFVATANAGEYTSEDELLAAFPEFGEPVKKKEESSVPLWLQKQEQQQPKPKQEQTLPFLESKPSGISLGSQRVPESAPMFEAPPMRTAEEAQAIVEAPEYREAKYFEGTFGELLSNMDNPAISPNTAWIGMGDFVDDFGRAIGQGSKTGDIVAPTSKIFLNGAKTSDEDIEKFRQASELADKLGPSDEMFRFSKEYQESGKTTSGFLKALANNPGAIPEIMVSSYSAMVNSTSLAAGGAVVGTGATTGAAAGAAAGGVGAIPGAVAGAVASIPYAMAAMGATLETNLSLAESIKDKLAQDGLEWNDENIKSVISDEKFLKDARIKAATRGVTIGAIDALTGRVAGKVGAKILKAPKGGAVKSAVAAGSIEAAGGSTGEATARALTGQEMDIAEIGLEGIAELPGTVVSVGSEVLRKPLYKVNGEIRPEADIKEIVETADGDQLSKINIEITNDDKGYNEQIQEKVVSAQVKNEVKEVNPDLDEETTNEITRLEMERKKFEGKKTQSAKDKLASINSQIKTLQENAVQKPSTEESVLRAEESQVGLQEVGEGNAQVQAPTEEVVQEEIVATPELSEDSQKIKTQLEDFQNAFDEAYNAEYPKSGTAQDKRSATAKSKKAVKKLQQMIGFDIGAYWELDADQTKKREALYSLRENKDYDSYDEMVAAYQKDVAEGNQSKLVESINTLLGIAPKEMEATPEEDLQAVLDRIEIPEDTEVLPGVDDELKTINESIGRVKEPVSRQKDDQVLQDLDDKISKAKRKIATADDADVAIEEFKQAQKEKADFEETINKKKNFSQVDGLISDEIYFRDRDKGQYEYQELFDQDPRLAALQSAKDMVEFARKNPDENINIENRESDIKILEEDIAKFPVKQAVSPATPVVEVAPKVSSKTQKAKIPKAKSVPIPVAIPKPVAPAPTPVPAPVAEITTEEQIATANRMAEKVGGVVVWQDGDVALIRGYGAIDGKPVYAVSIGNSRTRVDIEAFTGKDISPELKEKLVNIKKDLEAKEADKPRSIIYDSDGIATSKSIPEKVKGVISGWKKLLGINANIYITTTSDASSDKNNFVGPERVIGSAPLSQGVGSARRMSDGNYYVSMSDDASLVEILEILAHEMGHVHEKEAFANAPKEVKDAIIAEHKKFIEQSKGKTAKEFVEQLRPKNVGETTEVPEGMMADGLSSYWKSFSEWYADQVSKWANTTEKPLSIVDKFFSELAQQMKKFYNSLKGKKYLPNPTVKEFLDSIAKNAVIVDVAPPSAPTSKKPPAPKPVAVEGKFKKLKSLKDIQEDPRVESIYKERDDEGVSWWIELKDGYEWAYNSQIIHEYTVNGLLGVMNNDVQAVAKTAPQTTPTAVAPAPAPAPKPIAVVSQPTQRVQGPDALRQEYINKTNDVRLNKDKSRTPKQIDERIAELKAEYQKLKAEMTAPRPKAEPEAKAAPKVEAKPAPKQVETKAEPTSVVEEEEPSYDDIKDLDPTDETALKKVLRKLDSGDASLKQFGRGNLSSGMAIPLARAIIKALKVLVKTGITLQEAIKRVAAENNIEAKDIVNMIKDIEKSQSPMVKLKSQIQNEIQAVKDGARDANEAVKAIVKYFNFNAERGNLTRRDLGRVINAIAKVKDQKSLDKAADKIFDIIKKAKTDIIEVSDSKSRNIQIRLEARAALGAKKDINQKRKDLSNVIKEMETTGKISAAKAKAILNKIGKVNLDNPAAVDTFLDYVENVLEDAAYEVELAGINAKLSKARNNVNKKIGTAKNLTPILNRLFSIKPSLIPAEVFDAYKDLIDMFGDSAAVLDLAEITEVTQQAQSILDQIDDQLSTVPALATKLFNYENAVLTEDGALDYSATIEKMKADDTIDETEYDLMKKYKSYILPKAVKIPKTKQELADEKKVLVKQVKEAASETTISELASDDEKKMASNIIKLAKTNAVEALDNRQLENLLKIFDNFSNGYFPAYANGISNDLIAGENATFLSKAIAKAKMPSLASVKLRLRNKRKALFAKVKSSPLFNIDEIFGDFKTKDIFNSIFNALAQNQQRYTLEIEKINQRLEDALNKIAKTYNNNENKIVESKMKMAIYRIQREFQSNPGDSRVNPAMEYINKTIEAIREGDTNYSEEDADMLEQIAKEYSDGKGGIDATKLKESFNSAELEALDVFDKVNQELEGKATFTGDVIRGDKVYLLNDYNHVSVLPKKNENPDTIADAMSKFDTKNVVSTKAKSLIERTSGAKPINFDIFSTVQRGANFVLMDYYLTNPVRIARKSINAASKMMEENGTLNEDTKTIINVLKDSVELALKASLDQAVVKDTFADKVIKEMAKTGYRAMLGGIPRATTEFTSNMAYIAMVAPTEWSTGVKMMKVIRGGKAVDIMEAVGSKVISRVYGSDPLKGRLVDPSVLSKRVGIGASKLKGETLNVVSTIHNNTTKKVKNFVEFIADGLISTPDKIMMRPLWFGAFDKAFEDFSGKKPDYDKIASNDADYMIKNKEALDASGRVADEKVTMAGNVDNPYMNALRTNVSSDMSGLVKTFKVFDNFMLKFQIGEYLTARRGLYAMMGNGNISKEQGARLMAAVVTRMTVYTVMSKMAAEFMYGLFLDDEEEDDDKSFAQKMGQGLASTFTSLLLGRDLGNAARSVVNYGIEKTNENYLEFLRDGEYDPYEDAIQYTFIPPEKKGKSLEAFDVIANISGPYSPALKSLNFVTKKLTEEPKKEAAAIERQDSEKALRIPLEILGNLGYVPLYKDVRAIVNKSIYSELDKELDEQGKKGEEFKPMGMNKTDLKRYYPEIYEQYYGAGSEAEATRKLEYEKNLLERKMKDDYYNYVPKQRPKKGLGGKEFGSGSSKKGGGFGSKGFGK